jgi:hypothetical protein
MGMALTILGGIGVLFTVGVWFAYWAFKKWVLPLIKTQEQKDIAMNIVTVADDITDNLVEMFPDDKWDNHLDGLVDKLRKAIANKDVPKSKISISVAERAIRASLQRKKPFVSRSVLPDK